MLDFLFLDDFNRVDSMFRFGWIRPPVKRKMVHVPGQSFQCLLYGTVLHFHHQVYGTAPLEGPEVYPIVFLQRHLERGLGLDSERTEEPSFFFRFPDWKVPLLGQRGNDVNVAGFFAVHSFFFHGSVFNRFLMI